MPEVTDPTSPGDGIVLVDKQGGWTSHDVVARLRRLAGTRRVGHAGTLDPSATGLLVAGVGRGTRLLTYLTGCDKAYTATIRLGAATLTDDAEGEITSQAPPGAMEALTDEAITSEVATFVGVIHQVPSAVSAIKVNGQRSYARVRAGEEVKLSPRPVEVKRYTVKAIRRAPSEGEVREVAGGVGCGEGVAGTRPGGNPVDVDVEVEVSSGTFIRALARDLGAQLGVGGHVIALRRTRVGPFPVEESLTLDALATTWRILTLGEAASRFLPSVTVTPAQALRLARGQAVPLEGQALTAALSGDGTLIAITAIRDNTAYPTAVFLTPQPGAPPPSPSARNPTIHSP
ncbi:MAG: tRNA pseudouridine(55) synthase TruB [Micrococcales bacterium]|nr:tRNA pseudouridine(55) synthase TruB [Micrococcales bacterium]